MKVKMKELDLETEIEKDPEFAKTLNVVFALLAARPMAPGSIYRRLVAIDMPTNFNGYESVDSLLQATQKEGYSRLVEEGCYDLTDEGLDLQSVISKTLRKQKY